MNRHPSASAAGYEVVPVLTADAVAELLELHERTTGGTAVGFHATSVHAPRAVAIRVDTRVKQLVGPALQAVVEHHRPFLAAIITKAADGGPPVDFHQDLTHTDERLHRTVLAWIPLVDTDERNGTMSVIPGSHRWTTAIRPHTSELPTARHQHRFEQMAQPVPLAAGEALLYDAALVHGSGANLSSTDRPVVAVALAPVGVRLMLFTQGTDGTLRGHACAPSDFTARPFGVPPEDAEAVDPWDRAVDPEDFELVGSAHGPAC